MNRNLRTRKFKRRLKEITITMDITQNLESIYDGFINHEQPYTFFKGLYEYLDYVFIKPDLKRVFDQQMEERTILIKQIESLEKKTRQELDQAKTKLIALIKETKVDEMSFLRYLTGSTDGKTTLLQEIEAYENRTMLRNTFVSDNIEKRLFDITANLLNAGYKKELKEFIESPQEYMTHNRGNGYGLDLCFGGQDGTLIFSKTLSERRKKEGNFERERMLKSWGSFEILLQFNEAYKLAVSEDTSLASTPPDNTEKIPWFGAAKEGNKIFSMAREIQRLAESQLDFHSMVTTRFEKVRAGELKNLNQVVLKDAAKVVHGRLLRAFGDQENNDGTGNNSDMRFDQSTGELKFKDKRIRRFQKSKDDSYKFTAPGQLFLKLWGNRKTKDRGGSPILINNGLAVLMGLCQKDADFNKRAQEKMRLSIVDIKRMINEYELPLKLHITKEKELLLEVIR